MFNSRRKRPPAKNFNDENFTIYGTLSCHYCMSLDHFIWGEKVEELVHATTRDTTCYHIVGNFEGFNFLWIGDLTISQA